MDPNETLKLWRQAREGFANTDDAREAIAHAADMMLYGDVLDQWLSRGGFLPSAWNVPGTSAVRKLNPDNPTTSSYIQSDGFTV